MTTFSIRIGAALMTLAVVAGAATPESANLLTTSFGAGSYEAYRPTPTQVERANKIGFAFNVHYYREQGFVTTVVRLDYLTARDYDDRSDVRSYDVDILLPLYLTSARFRPALAPLFGAHYVQGKGGGSQGQVGALVGCRYQLLPGRCVFTDLLFGWRGRYGALPGDLTDDPEGWKSAIVFRNADTIAVAKHFCLYFTAAADYNLTAIRDERRKPTLVMTAGPAITW